MQSPSHDHPRRQYWFTAMAAMWLLLGLGTIAPAQEANQHSPNPVCVFDLTDLNKLDLHDPAQARRAWDTLHLATSIQGIVNRDRAVLFLRFMKHPDDFWFSYLREEGNWLADRPVKAIHSVQKLLETFQEELRGVVAYKEDVYALSNVASTIAGIENRVCLRYDSASTSVYAEVMATELPFLQNVVRLFNEDGTPMFNGAAGSVIPGTGSPGIASSGSAKCDAYLWAKHRYLDTNLASNEFMANYIDSYWLTAPAKTSLSNCTLTNHDFFIANKAFFFDLNVWEEESSVDDPSQPPGTDLKTLKALLRSTHDRAGGRILQIGGFAPWVWKYTNHPGAGSKHGGVDTEWKYVQVVSSYNGVIDADALDFSGMANASFYQHFPLREHYPQNKRPTHEDLKKKGLVAPDGRVAPYSYVLFYLGDYDAAAWLNRHLPQLWQDPARGTIPCAWAFNPNLDRRAPHAMHFARTMQGNQDWFMSGNSGAGYLNPGMLTAPRPDPEVPDGWDSWIAYCRRYYRRYDLSITGFIIDGHSPAMGERGLDAYLQFSPDGIVGHKIPVLGLRRDTMPMIQKRMDLYGSPPEAGAQVAELIDPKNLPQFTVIRTILKSPSWHKATMKHARQAKGGEKLRFVDPYTFFLLLKAHLTVQ